MIAAVTHVAWAPPAAPTILSWPATPRQGQTLFFRSATGDGVREPVAYWDQTALPVQSRAGSLAGVVGLKITERTGAHVLRLRFRDATGEPRELRTSIVVGRTRFPVRHLTMKKSTERLYNFPGAKQEDAIVSRAVRTKSAMWLWDGAFRLPTQGRSSTPFGVKRIRNRRTSYYHRGLDIAASTGTPVVAPNHGRVVIARRFRKYGNSVILDHGGGVTSLYLHMSALHVREGDTVATGRRLGDVGMTGVATGPHLHWGFYVHGVAVNPLSWTKLPPSLTEKL